MNLDGQTYLGKKKKKKPNAGLNQMFNLPKEKEDTMASFSIPLFLNSHFHYLLVLTLSIPSLFINKQVLFRQAQT